MSVLHDRLLENVASERERLMTRRRVLAGAVKISAAGAFAASLSGATGMGLSPVRAQDSMYGFSDDRDVLNYALTLEHLEYAFYRDGIGQFTFGTGPFGENIDELLMAVRDHEGAHVATLTQVIIDLDTEPVAEATYDFGYTDMQSFLLTAAALENTGVRAYDGAGQFLASPELLTAAGSIVAIEARHASYLNLLTGAMPFPAAYESPATPDEILEIAGPFIVS